MLVHINCFAQLLSISRSILFVSVHFVETHYLNNSIYYLFIVILWFLEFNLKYEKRHDNLPTCNMDKIWMSLEITFLEVLS